MLLLLLVVVVARASIVPRLLPVCGLAVARLLLVRRLAVASLLPIRRLAVASLLPKRGLVVATLLSIKLAVAWLPISRLAVRLARPGLLVARRLVVRLATATVPVVGCMRLGGRRNGQRPAALDGTVGGVFQGVGGLQEALRVRAIHRDRGQGREHAAHGTLAVRVLGHPLPGVAVLKADALADALRPRTGEVSCAVVDGELALLDVLRPRHAVRRSGAHEGRVGDGLGLLLLLHLLMLRLRVRLVALLRRVTLRHAGAVAGRGRLRCLGPRQGRPRTHLAFQAAHDSERGRAAAECEGG
mmetsp:Transcript_62651/g.204480  ORF Transcript_62651/g.204480 Transcript_62651/m.204480 type:complete len:300 (+) Transcript_62651:456-1355(+)